MSQKINPISFRLGLFQVWNNTFQIYGRNFYSYYQLLFLKSALENYLNKKFFKNSILLNSIYWFTNFDTIILVIDCVSTNKLSIQILNLRSIKQFCKNINLKFYVIKNFSWLNSANLVSNYIRFNFNKTNSIKSGLRYLVAFLVLRLYTKKIVYTVQGTTVLRLKGFKIKVSGCFDNTRSQMSKSLVYTKGSLSLLKINSYVEYSYVPIYTKSGVNSFHIWLFYTN